MRETWWTEQNHRHYDFVCKSGPKQIATHRTTKKSNKGTSETAQHSTSLSLRRGINTKQWCCQWHVMCCFVFYSTRSTFCRRVCLSFSSAMDISLCESLISVHRIEKELYYLIPRRKKTWNLLFIFCNGFLQILQCLFMLQDISSCTVNVFLSSILSQLSAE